MELHSIHKAHTCFIYTLLNLFRFKHNVCTECLKQIGRTALWRCGSVTVLCHSHTCRRTNKHWCCRYVKRISTVTARSDKVYVLISIKLDAAALWLHHFCTADNLVYRFAFHAKCRQKCRHQYRWRCTLKHHIHCFCSLFTRKILSFCYFF